MLLSPRNAFGFAGTPTENSPTAPPLEMYLRRSIVSRMVMIKFFGNRERAGLSVYWESVTQMSSS